MGYASDAYTGVFRCEKCGRKAGVAMLACPERPAGTCPYRLEEVGGGKGSCALVTVIAFALAVLALIAGLSQGEDFITGLAVLAALGLGAGGALGVMALLSDSANVLVNPQTGASWTHVTLLQRTFSEQITLPTQVLRLDVVLDAPLRSPASIAVLRPEIVAGGPGPEVHQHAIEVVELTLTALLAQGAIGIRLAERYASFFGRPLKLETLKYLVTPGPGEAGPLTVGALEERLLHVIDDWHCRELAEQEQVRLLTVEWQLPPQHGMEAHRLVQSIFEGDELDPYRWLLTLVHQDALDRGAWERVPSDWRRGRTIFKVPQAHRLRADTGRLLELHERLLRTYPDVMLELRRQIEAAFNLRRAS